MIKRLNTLDKYITKQVIETFLISLVIFTSIIFATDAFITIVRQITEYGIPLRIAAMLVMLKLPSMLILTIPMGILLSTIMTVNKMNNALEITILKACGIGVSRISRPILICASIATLISFTVNEFVAPVASQMAKKLTVMSIMQKNVPNGKRNFIFKEVNSGQLRRFFHIASVNKNQLNNITVLDLSRDNTIQVVYAKHGSTATTGWVLNNGVVYTISTTGTILNTAVFNSLNFDNASEAIKKLTEETEEELNYFALRKHIKKVRKNLKTFMLNKLNEQVTSEEKIHLIDLKIMLNEKLAMPFTSIVFALIAIPLAITGPRARFNRGLLFSILILFMYYMLRAVSISVCENEFITPLLAAWVPNLVLFTVGIILYRRKAYFI